MPEHAGVRPEDLRPRRAAPEVLETWAPSASALFDWLRARATRDHLANIAAADYGHDAERHLAALEEICETGLVPLAFGWHPGEVVELTRWSTEESVVHLERALSCVLVCLSSQDDELVNTGPPLVESCIALGEQAASLAERFIAWHCETLESDAGEVLICLLLLVILRASRAPADPRIAALLRHMSLAPDLGSLREAMASSQRYYLWQHLVDSIVMPLYENRSPLAPLLEAIGI